MSKIPSILLAAAVLFYGAVAQAQMPAQSHAMAQSSTTQSPAYAPPAAGLSLEGRYIQCISAALCPLHERLQIVQEETNEMNTRFQKIFETCAAKNFQDCTDAQQAEMDAWHSADYRAGQMMLSIEAQSLALKESAAGGPDKTAARKKSLWDRLWGK